MQDLYAGHDPGAKALSLQHRSRRWSGFAEACRTTRAGTGYIKIFESVVTSARAAADAPAASGPLS